MVINKSDPMPLHYQLKQVLRDIIKNGEWTIGDLFPTDKELMQKYDLSSTTVRRAVSELVREGWLDRTPGKGTFIRREAVEEPLGRLTGFFEEMSRQGFIPSAQILQAVPVTITAKDLAKHPHLSVFKQSELFLIEKIQKIENMSIVYLLCYWPHEYGKKIAEYDLSKEGIYQVANRELKLVLTKAEQTISAGAANREVAQLLGIKPGFPVLITERITYAEEEPVEYSYNIYRADQYKFNVVLQHDHHETGGVWGQNSMQKKR